MFAGERHDRMRWRPESPFRCATLLFLLLSLLLGGVVLGQDPSRKVIARTAPTYPELGKRAHLSGKVKLEVVITPGGSVKSVKLIGGNPVFEKNAIEAARQWRFEPAPKETQAVILLKFAEP
jgi:TonB family protein